MKEVEIYFLEKIKKVDQNFEKLYDEITGQKSKKCRPIISIPKYGRPIYGYRI